VAAYLHSPRRCATLSNRFDSADRMCILYLARVTLTPRADTDGLILGDGTEVKTAASSDGDRLFGDPCKGHFPHLLCALRR
jgi:hypothetical protein